MSYPIAPDEDARLAALYELELLDSPDEPAFDRVTRLVTKLLNVPISTVTLIDAKRQWLKSRVGVDTRETSRDVAFCAYTIMGTEPLIINDASQDPRFAHNPFVTAVDGIRFYAGIPLSTTKGLMLGSLCAIDTKPRAISESELAALQDLAAIVTDEIHLRERLVLEKKNAQLSQQALNELHHSMECQIERRTNELKLVIESAYDAYISIDAKDVILDWNRAAEAMFGWPRKKALARTITQLIFPAGLPSSNNRAAIISMARRQDGTELPVEVRIKALMIDGRERRSLFIHDITERQQLERLRDQQAREDVLTKLPNRRALDERLPEAMARTRRSQQPLAVLFMDLDGFKAINDAYGHAKGDDLLRVIAKKLVSTIRETDYIARWAGDEFVVLLEGSEPTAIEQLANKLVKVVEEPMIAGTAALNVSVSIGVALYLPASAETANELLKRADVAMYEAKRSGKAQVSIAQPADNSG
ncbi:diguanylate cyclase [Halomonas sp. ISL-60]|uniref:diguanylate cyclase domain-containing protein n=1 Tax=unclassified Halomonas TaxID=2609666 RepID=UPI0007D9F91A|nr:MULTISPECIES: diguanylate cyclase [unclassified Halomonas]MBT2774623.1 diguanylate cyclase [Halomonas sp. ISL-60]MBT2785602.1 diguanylate cyclase [Halomonas sp. ISL-106]MBT2797714.1 diguanylate cyclase [Halomonas sp. ISL-104]MBT2801275.1 diguanylate cyclase [Halomonas sp. ISL-56]OAL59486.1 diguanylate cyclase [Halomonas sp. ALS9]